MRLVEAEDLARACPARSGSRPRSPAPGSCRGRSRMLRGLSPATSTSTASGSGKAGEVIEVAVAAVGVVGVAVARALGRGGQHGDAAAHLGGEPGAAPRLQGWIDPLSGRAIGTGSSADYTAAAARTGRHARRFASAARRVLAHQRRNAAGVVVAEPFQGRRSPAAGPPTGRFWLSLNLPSSRVISISNPTMPASILSW